MRLLIAGGGTGGHIYPGIAVARAWLRNGPDYQVLFVGTQRGVEARVLPREGLALETISAAGVLGKSIFQKIIAVLSLIKGIIQSWKILGRFQPAVVLGVGGYASAPAVVAAWMKGRPIILMEQNAFPGITNRILSRLAKKVTVGLPGAAKYFPAEKVVETGMPLREEVSKFEPRSASFWEGPLRVLIFGGSQGAHAINSAVAGALRQMGDSVRNFHFVHQTGEADLEQIRKVYEETGAKGEVAAFLYDMGERYRCAHLAVARAGAMTVAELSAMGVPALLIPLPTSAQGHQEANARYLFERGAARMILQNDLTGEGLAAFFKEIYEDRKKLIEMSGRNLELAGRDASVKVANICQELARAA